MANQPVNHTVTLTYSVDPITLQPKVEVNPRVTRVGSGDTIEFLRAGSLQGSMHVTFKDRKFFDTDNRQFRDDGIFHEGDGPVRVTARPNATTYHCALVDANGKRIADSDEHSGGAIEPVDNA